MLLIFAGGVPVELSVGIIPERYPFEMVGKALGWGAEALRAADRHPSSQWQQDSLRRVSLDRRLRCPGS
jgi:hypothetical protein